MLELANMVRRKKAFENNCFLYETINKNPRITIYDLTKLIGWSSGKITYYISKLIKDGMIINSTEVVNGRNKRLFSSKSVKEFINWDEMKNTDKKNFK